MGTATEGAGCQYGRWSNEIVAEIDDPSVETLGHETRYVSDVVGTQDAPIAEHVFETKGGPSPITVTTRWVRSTLLGNDAVTTTTTVPYDVVKVATAPTTHKRVFVATLAGGAVGT